MRRCCPSEETSFSSQRWLGFTATKFSERLFGILDLDASGFLDFREFLIGIWNVSTYDVPLFTKFAFSIFDVENKGSLEMAECDALLRMVYNVRKADSTLLKKIDVNGDGVISLDEFQKLVDVHNYMLQPAFDIQRALRQRVCGVRYWESEMRRRRTYFSGYDADAQSSWNSIKLILEIKHAERMEQERRQHELEAADRRAEVEAATQREMKLREELAMRRRRRAEERRARTETAEATAERSAQAAMDTAEAEMDEECVAADLTSRIAQRETFWNAFEAWVEACRVARAANRANRIRLAVGADAEAKLEEYINTPDGRVAFDYEVALNYAYDLHDRLITTRRCTALVGRFAKSLVVDHFGDGVYQPTSLAKFAMRLASKPSLAAARERARGSLLADVRDKEEKRVLADLDDFERDQERLFVATRLQKIGERGGLDSKWERLWDGVHGVAYWHNWKTSESLWERPHICHHCDAVLDVDDVRCFQCNSERSAYNQARYREAHGIQPTKSQDDANVSDDEGCRNTAQPNNGETHPDKLDDSENNSTESAQEASCKSASLAPGRFFGRRKKSVVLPHYLEASLSPK